MWSENIMKTALEGNLRSIIDEEVVLLDLDTYNTPARRPDMVLLSKSKQLIVVELERELTLRNIEHALVDQAWAAAKYWYVTAKQSDIQEMYRYYRKYKYPNQTVPNLRDQLQLSDGDHILLDRQKKVIVIAAGWHIETGVIDKARELMKAVNTSDRRPMPCDVRVCKIRGEQDQNGCVRIVGCRTEQVYDRTAEALPDGKGLPLPGQHMPVRLSGEFREVWSHMPRFLSYGLKADMDVYSKARWEKQIMKFCP